MSADETSAVPELAAALAEDPVQVDPLFGNGRTEDVDAALTAVVEDLPFPAYVVLAPGPAGLSTTDAGRDLAGRLHELIGGDAVFVVQTDPKSHGMAVVSFGDVPDETAVYGVDLEFFPNGGSEEGLHPAGIAARTLEVLGTLDEGGEVTREQLDAVREQAVFRRTDEWDPTYDPPTAETIALGTTFALVAVTGGAYLALRNLLRWHATGPGARPRAATDRAVRAGLGTPAEVRAAVEGELESLARLLARSAGGPAGLERRALVDGSYDVARALLERTGTAEAALDDLVGALVLVRTAARAAGAEDRSEDRPGRRRGRRGRSAAGAGDPTPYRPCFFDPRHGEGLARRTVPVGDRELTVPACRACSHTTGRGLAPMTVRSGLLGRERPWYELDTVWARTGYGAFVDDLWRHVARETGGVR
ncbi:hypothetical protein QWY28_11750 [Nocardioides sp. SOB77]|uniref:Uncharacterized protein n=1 Tax=Nocardioides oceani TaxID=3058369 RepID=A0ABT8FG25_9ACTN|nr:hypothetical protein [Nocardioides oceani]MDN4173623.1 hypothetical protein [Nocardioides oceani]